jgi:putative flippase GtrA
MKLPETVKTNNNFSLRSVAFFLAVGAFATGLHYLLTCLFIFSFGTTLVLASAYGFAISAAANYFLTRRLTFRSSQPHVHTAPRFIVTAGTGLLINCLFLLFFESVAGLHPIFAQILSTLGVLIWNYSINGLWTFKRRTM